MAINIKKYVDITSSVGGTAALSEKDLIGRLFTNNELLPTDSFVEFTSAEEAGVYFGTTSEEYLRAVKYFSRISKSGFNAKKISYAKYTDADTPPKIFGSRFTTTLAEFQAITDGATALQMGNVNVISTLNFSTALSFADVAALIQAGINAEAGLMWTGATVAYNASRGSFDLVGGESVAAVVAVMAGMTGTEIADLIGWGELAILSDGSLAQTVTDTLQASTNASNNFATFLFMPALTLDEKREAAIWNGLQNFQFLYTYPTLKVDAQANYDELNEIGGTGQTISESTTYTEMDPMILAASTQYNQSNSVLNYMFQQFPGDAVSVSDTAEAAAFDLIRTNYYGQTQTSGQKLSFYQNAFLFGGLDDAIDMNTYVNEIWLKDAMLVATMNLLLAVEKVSANLQGIAQVSAVHQTVIDRALNNGTISVGKPLDDAQKLYVTNLTGDSEAWHSVQNVGFIYDSYIEKQGLIFVYVYTLVYSKDDVIRKVIGKQILI